MKNNVVIKLLTTQIYEDEQPETLEYMTEGRLEKTPDGIKIFYDEPNGGLKDVKNEITVSTPDFVTLSREGEYTSVLSIEKGKRHNCLYDTPYGSFMMGVFASDVNACFYERDGQIDLKYTVDCNTSVVSENTVKIRVENIL